MAVVLPSLRVQMAKRRTAQSSVSGTSARGDADGHVVQRFGEGDALAPRPAVRGRGHQAQLVLAVVDAVQAGEVGGVPQHTHVGGAFAHGADNVGADAFVQAHAHGGVLAQEAADVAAQLFCQHRRRSHHTHAALHAGGKFAQLGVHARHHAQHLTRLPQQRLAGSGGRNATAPAHQQRRADLRFHSGDHGYSAQP